MEFPGGSFSDPSGAFAHAFFPGLKASAPAALAGPTLGAGMGAAAADASPIAKLLAILRKVHPAVPAAGIGAAGIAGTAYMTAHKK